MVRVVDFDGSLRVENYLDAAKMLLDDETSSDAVEDREALLRLFRRPRLSIPPATKINIDMLDTVATLADDNFERHANSAALLYLITTHNELSILLDNDYCDGYRGENNADNIAMVRSTTRPMQSANYRRRQCAFRSLQGEASLTPDSLAPRGALNNLLSPLQDVERTMGFYGAVEPYRFRSIQTDAIVAKKQAHNSPFVNSYASLSYQLPLSAQEQSLVHEAFVALVGMNVVYETRGRFGSCPPVFSLDWGFAFCGVSFPKMQNKTILSRLLSKIGYGIPVVCPPGASVVEFKEYISGNLTFQQCMSNFDRVDAERFFSVTDLASTLLLVADGLETAWRNARFSHQDLHGGNVMMIRAQDVDNEAEIEKNRTTGSLRIQLSNAPFVVNARFLPRIIDYGTAAVTIGGQRFAYTNGGQYGTDAGPLTDFFMLVRSAARSPALRHAYPLLLPLIQLYFDFQVSETLGPEKSLYKFPFHNIQYIPGNYNAVSLQPAIDFLLRFLNP